MQSFVPDQTDMACFLEYTTMGDRIIDKKSGCDLLSIH